MPKTIKKFDITEQKLITIAKANGGVVTACGIVEKRAAERLKDMKLVHLEYLTEPQADGEGSVKMSLDAGFPEFPIEPVAYDRAIEMTQEWLEDNVLTKQQRKLGIECAIYDYLDGDDDKLIERPYVGVRVAEVSFHTSTGGGSYMQTDAPWGIAVCGQVERCILALVEGWNQTIFEYGAGYADADTEFWRLGELFKEMNREDR